MRPPAKTIKQARHVITSLNVSNDKLSSNKLSDNNFASELVVNRTFLSEEIVIFMIKVLIPG